MKSTNISESQAKKNGTVKPKSEGSDNKIRFPLWIYPETMEKVDAIFESDNCRSKSEFIEKAIKFYTGYLLQERNVNYLAPRITSAVDAIVLESTEICLRLRWSLASSPTLLPPQTRSAKTL